MTAERLRRFDPVPGIDHRYKVRILTDRWDGDSDRISRIVTAIGQGSAWSLAHDLRDRDFPGGSVLAVEPLCDDCGPHEAHPGKPCSHQSESPTQVYPCPCGRSDLELQYEFGYL